MRLFDQQFSKSISHHVLQSLMAVTVLLIALAILEIEAHLIVIAAVASSTFVVFATPGSKQARTRSLVGGHIVGVLSGAICYLPFFWLSSKQGSSLESLLLVLAGAVAVGLAIFLMTITGTGHPPAAGTALGIVLQGLTWTAAVFVVSAAIGLSVVRWLLRGWLRNLV